MDAQRSPRDIDARFLYTVGGLMLLIMLMLAGLWLRMRRRATSAERQIALLRLQVKPAATMPDGLREAIEAQFSQPLVKRDALLRRSVTLDGRQVEALRLPVATAEILGLRPGDAVLVDPAAATASAPAP